MVENQSEQIKKASIEKEAFDHYFKVMDKMVEWCIFQQPPEIEAFLTAFQIDKGKLTIRALKAVIEKWESKNEDI